ncbi:M3 family oligoendopeptidase [Sporosalibacterium faouarense]|uniref:M3 family oligoendopeptidase n=1 Tax=Sporosalibacterium faouarense TaxID=516123 RepID=UPI00192C124B|nr:M3 family oligoendopeptidase [Sporosalibacterium faouarense]
MNMRWSLDALYPSFESDDFNSDLEKSFDMINKIKTWSENNLEDSNNAAKKMEEYLKLEMECLNLYSKVSAFARLTSSVDAKNEKALKILDKLQSKATELTKPEVTFQKWLNTLDNLDDIISSSDFLKNHKFYIKENASKAKYLLSDEEEILISKMSNTGSKAWANLQNVVSSTLMVDITVDDEEKKLPLPVVRNMAYNKDPNVRKNAYEAELKAYKKIEESSAAALNGIKGEVLTICEMRGYESPLEETLIKSRMDKETLDAMLTAMKESLPTFHRYYHRKAELLGYENGLPFYEMFAPIGEVDIEFSYEEAKNYIVKNFRSFSDELANFAKNAFEERWIDAEPREGKRGGAFCSNLHSIKESRILANFNGSFSNMTTLAHELGHGYHGHCLNDETVLNSSYTMPVAETASIFCETIVENAALKDANDKEALSILESSIQGYGQVIVDIYSRFLFESKLFEERKDHALSVNELKEIMTNSQKESYGHGLDHNYLHPYMWTNKPHYYYAGLNFYNFPYAFGLLFAKGVYAEYLKRGDLFVKEYDKLLRATGQNDIYDVCKMMNIDVHSVDFWRSSLNLIKEDIEKFIDLSKSI